MTKSITTRFFLLIFVSILILLLLVNGSIRFFLPDYYMTQKLKTIDTQMAQLAEVVDDPVLLTERIDDIQTTLGGQVDILDEEGNQKGYGKGRMATGNQTNANTYIIPDDQTESFNTEYTNRYGVLFIVYGIPVGQQWLLYQIPINSIDETISVFTDFYNYVLIFGAILSLIIALIISKSITQPILTLNEETKALIDKKPQRITQVTREDEIGQLEHSIHYLYQSLEANIQRLDTELANEKKADILRKEFLAQVSHELKTPMAVIKGYSEILMDGLYSDKEKYTQFIENIYNETEHVDTLLMDITDYSKMASGHFQMTKTHTVIQPWAMTLMEKMTPLIEGESIAFNTSINTGDLALDMDPYRMEQVIKILLNNALEHTEDTISLLLTKENNHMILTCENNGSKINEEDLPFIFNSFYKKKGKQKGSGLGLAILKEIVLHHNGSYHVENTETGVRFKIIL